MAIRTTSELVAGIIEVDEAIPLEPFILAASLLVDKVAADENVDHDATTLEVIERWLSAHFYAQRDPRPTSERAGTVSQSLQSAVAVGLDNTHYGQMAMTLDTSGRLRSLSKGKRRASVTWLGTATDTES